MNKSNLPPFESLGFARIIRKTRSSADFEMIADAYGALRDECPKIKREEGVSFNPRPIRLAQIFLEADAQACVGDIVSVMQEDDTQDILIRYARSLDTIRHLHMSSFFEEEKKALLEEGREIAFQLEVQKNNREAKKLRHAISLRER